MRFFALTTMTAFLLGLFAFGQVLGAGQEESSKTGESQEQVGTPGQAQDQQVAAGQFSSEQVRQIQQSLEEKGADPGTVDGIMGPKTEQAIREFQQDQGIAASGELDQQTLEALDLQEFMGVSPEFGEEQQRQETDTQQQEQQPEQQQMEQEQMDQQQMEQQPEKSPGM